MVPGNVPVRRPPMLMLVISVAALLLAQSFARAQQGTAPVPTFRSGVQAVAVDVVVTGKDGKAVSGLSQDDFEVVEAGVQRPITTFTAVDFGEADADALSSFGGVETDVATNTLAEGRVFIIALDELSSVAASSTDGVDGALTPGPILFDRILQTRQMLREFIEHSFGPNDVAAVVLLGRGLVHSGQDFTSSKRRLIRAIESFSGGFSSETPGSQEEKLALDINRIASLRDLVEFLAKLPARRKALLLMSQGLGDIDVGHVLDNSSRARTLKTFCVETLPPPGSRNIISCRPSQDMHALLVAAARGNVAIYPIDPTGVTGGGRDQDFVDLAAATGGFAVSNTNPREWLPQITLENGSYYRLGIESAYTKQDGQMVAIDVRMRKPGLTVRTRRGYLAGFPDERRIDATDTSTLGGAVASPIATPGIPLRAAVPVFKDARGDGLIAVVLDVDPRTIMSRAPNGEASGVLNVSYLATDVNRRVHEGGRHRITLAVKPGGREQNAARIIVPMTLPKGRYQVRVGVSTQQGGTGSVVCDVDVPDFSRVPAMSGIVVVPVGASQVSTFWPAGRSSSGPLSWLPTTRRSFARGERLALYGELYAKERKPAGESFLVSATLHSGAGDALKVEALVAMQKSKAGFSLDVPLERVPPGAYVLTVAAGISESAQVFAEQQIPLVVQ